jgi:hypothetical protein
MSVAMGAYLVDWDDFQEKVRHADASDVLEEIERQPLTDESARAPWDFLEVFDGFKRAWKSDAKLYFKEVFDTLFSFCRGSAYQVMELEEGESEDSDLFGIDTALRPETVKELVDLARKVYLEECRPLFENHLKGSQRFNSFNEWRSYGEEWLTLLRRAADQDQGFIITNFG